MVLVMQAPGRRMRWWLARRQMLGPPMRVARRQTLGPPMMLAPLPKMRAPLEKRSD
jgi:hypothetical protein